MRGLSLTTPGGILKVVEPGGLVSAVKRLALRLAVQHCAEAVAQRVSVTLSVLGCRSSNLEGTAGIAFHRGQYARYCTH
jgi:EAL domain-containing protein (putative c-di-GMP-specific phosphodiesterase class I)